MLLFLTLPLLFTADVSLYAPTPLVVVERMLEIAEIEEDDVVYDLGSGDGRLVILASLIYGCRSVGIENDGKLVKRSRRNVRQNKVSKLVEIKHQDVLEANLEDADVILVYLMSDLLEKLKPQFSLLRDGVRIIAHSKPIPGMIADDKYEVEMKTTNTFHTVYVYTTPLQEKEKECAT